METLNSVLTEPVNWLIIATVCVILEMFTGMGIGIAFAIPAALTGLVIFTFGITNLMVALAWFIAFSVLSVFITWKWFKRMKNSSSDINQDK